ncbi:hypothetical protein [Streptomyces sp. NBC_00103]|uniref:hypothetical protein n=1 Tax=Streptomyces sp. NBC_00103 TaxID=2975653 RepID=UPI00224E414E|nr:hypothetical protein [Streptomyces sp. NBC_00103]MCX5374793.1 hypothetical protein [Streptomyces sp. NBC_00103]
MNTGNSMVVSVDWQPERKDLRLRRSGWNLGETAQFHTARPAGGVEHDDDAASVSPARFACNVA